MHRACRPGAGSNRAPWECSGGCFNPRPTRRPGAGRQPASGDLEVTLGTLEGVELAALLVDGVERRADARQLARGAGYNRVE